MDEIEISDVTIKVSGALIACLEQWSEPVQIRIREFPDGTFSMEARDWAFIQRTRGLKPECNHGA